MSGEVGSRLDFTCEWSTSGKVETRGNVQARVGQEDWRLLTHFSDPTVSLLRYQVKKAFFASSDAVKIKSDKTERVPSTVPDFCLCSRTISFCHHSDFKIIQPFDFHHILHTSKEMGIFLRTKEALFSRAYKISHITGVLITFYGTKQNSLSRYISLESTQLTLIFKVMEIT